MRRLCDLHTHSTSSDGSLSPAELVRQADRARLAGVALTDHDTVAGVAQAAEAARDLPELTFVPGVELSAIPPQGTLHILGLGIDPRSAALLALMRQLRQARDERNPKMVARLRQLGLDISMEEVTAQALKGGAAAAEDVPPVVGRAHMAEVMVRKGMARSIADAFARYLGLGTPAYVDKERLPPAEVIHAIHSAGGLALLAHPVHLQFGNFAEAERLIRILVEAGMDGLEVYHSDHSILQTRFFLDLARRLNLAVSGGSDFHGAVKPHVQLGRPRVPVHIMHELLERASSRASKN